MDAHSYHKEGAKTCEYSTYSTLMDPSFKSLICHSAVCPLKRPVERRLSPHSAGRLQCQAEVGSSCGTHNWGSGANCSPGLWKKNNQALQCWDLCWRKLLEYQFSLLEDKQRSPEGPQWAERKAPPEAFLTSQPALGASSANIAAHPKPSIGLTDTHQDPGAVLSTDWIANLTRFCQCESFKLLFGKSCSVRNKREKNNYKKKMFYKFTNQSFNESGIFAGHSSSGVGKGTTLLSTLALHPQNILAD